MKQRENSGRLELRLSWPSAIIYANEAPDIAMCNYRKDNTTVFAEGECCVAAEGGSSYCARLWRTGLSLHSSAEQRYVLHVAAARPVASSPPGRVWPLRLR